MRVPRRYMVAGAVAAATLVSALTCTAFVLLAVDADDGTRLPWFLLAVSAGLVTAGCAAVGLALPFVRRVWIRSRRNDRLARIERRIDDLPSRRIFRGVDERVAAIAQRSEDMLAVVGDVRERIEGVPTTAHIHKVLEASSQGTQQSVQQLGERVERVAADARREVDVARTATASEMAELSRRLGRVESATATSTRDLYGQIDGLASLYSMLRPDRGLPPLLIDWAVAADLGGHLVRHVLANRPTAIVELGSGASTVLLAMASRHIDGRPVLSVEHDEHYAHRTRSLLAEYGVGEWADVVVAPLVDVQVADETFAWYDLSHVTLPAVIDLLIVDGPPGNTGALARFPAVPLLRDRLGDASTVLLDDARRDDERQIMERWCADHGLRMVRPVRFTTGTAELATS